jgi:hypothetical protein
MRSLVTRRATLVAGAAAVAVVALAGCSAGQVAETSLKRPSNMGVNENNSNDTVVVRNLAVTYNGPAGYASGDDAPLEVGLYNQTTQPVTVTVSSQRPAAGDDGVVNARSAGLVGPAPTDSATPADSASDSPSPSDSASASNSASPAKPAAQPASITIAPLGAATFRPGDQESLRLIGLSGKLVPGRSAYVTFTFDNGAAPLTLPAPVGIPLSPAPRGSGIENENSEE